MIIKYSVSPFSPTVREAKKDHACLICKSLAVDFPCGLGIISATREAGCKAVSFEAGAFSDRASNAATESLYAIGVSS